MKKINLILCVMLAAVLLISTGADAAMSNEEFLELCAVGSGEEVESAIKAGADLKARNEDDQTPLFVAARFNDDPEAVAVLIEAGAELDDKDRYGETALMAAAKDRWDETEALSKLISSGAGMLDTDDDGDIALHLLQNQATSGVLSIRTEK
jgi:ankyrin repeat protein